MAGAALGVSSGVTFPRGTALGRVSLPCVVGQRTVKCRIFSKSFITQTV